MDAVETRRRKRVKKITRAERVALLDTAVISKPVIDRFHLYVHPEPNSGCWLWSGRLHRTGYGQFTPGTLTRPVTAHRFSLGTKTGKWPRDCALHSCDNKACVNPDHLREGTQSENIADRNTRKRTARGSASGPAVLTEDQVKAIRKRLASGSTQRRVASEFGVTPPTIRNIAIGVTWKHVD